MFYEEKFGKGAADRPEDWYKVDSPTYSEISGAFSPVVWKEKKFSDFVTYPKRNQGTTLSCTCYTQAKLLSIDEFSENGKWRELSPHGLYPFVVFEGGGASGVEVARSAAKYGMTLEHLYPSDGLTEEEMRKSEGLLVDAKQVGLIYKSDMPVECLTDFDTIASILDGYQKKGKRKGVAVTIIGRNNGTWISPFPTPPTKTDTDLWFHRVPVVDFGLIKGKKYLAIDNSWGEEVGNKGQQYLGEEFLPFLYGGLYTLNIPDNWQENIVAPTPPKYVWSLDLQVGSSGKDVLLLQQALQSLGMFPVASVVGATGNFGGITKQAVILFQQAFGISATGVVGPKTREKLNSLFN